MREVEEISVTRGSGHVFADLGLPNAEEYLEKAKLVSAMQNAIDAQGMTLAKAAKRIGVTRPALRLILRGRLQERLDLLAIQPKSLSN